MQLCANLEDADNLGEQLQSYRMALQSMQSREDDLVMRLREARGRGRDAKVWGHVAATEIR